MKLTTALSITTLSLVALAPLASARQDGTFPPPEQPRGRGDGPEGERPRPAADPQQFIDRMMGNDANGDGKLSKDELPPPLADRLFERADTNKDGFIDRSELETAAKSGGLGGRGAARGGAGGAGGAGGPANVEASMKQMNRAYRTLNASQFTPESRKADLDGIQALQGAIVGAKGGGANLRMSDTAKARFGDDRVKFEAEFRAMMLETLLISIDIERAVLAGDGSKAKELVAKLHGLEEKGHELFQPSEGGEAGDAGQRAPGEGQPPRGGRGGRARQGTEGSGERPRRGAPEGGN
jgi:hypothetical protein